MSSSSSDSEREPLIRVCSVQRSDVNSSKLSKFRQFRESKTLVVLVVFVAMMLDLIVLTSIDPLLPNIIHRMDMKKLNKSLQLEMKNSTNRSEHDVNITAMFNMDSLTNPDEKASLEARVGLLISLKPATEVIANIVVGAIVAKFGHIYPMMIGFIFNTGSTIGFAYAPTYEFLILARVCQAVASSLSVISGLALISSTFNDETERSKAISRAFGGLSLGIVVGYPFGSITYEFVGRKVPFISLAVLSLFDGVLRMFIAEPRDKKRNQSRQEQLKKPTAYMRLLKDPYIICALLCNFAPNFALGVFLATGPAWMLSTLHAKQWEIGAVLAIAIWFQLLTQYLSGIYAIKYGPWKFCMLGMWLYSAGQMIYPHCTIVWMVTAAEILTRSGFGMVICVVSPFLSHIVDIRHDSNYGEVFGLYTASYNIGLTIGPLAGGFVLQFISFGTLYRSVGGFIFLVSLLCLFLRNAKPTNIASCNDGHSRGLPRQHSDEGFYSSIERSYMERGNTTWYLKT